MTKQLWFFEPWTDPNTSRPWPARAIVTAVPDAVAARAVAAGVAQELGAIDLASPGIIGATTPAAIHATALNGAAPGLNLIDNGGFEVNQVAGPWTTQGKIIDRWHLTTDAGEITVTREDITPGDVPGCRHALRMVVGATNSDVRLTQFLDVPLKALADRALLVSFWAKSDVSTGFSHISGRRTWGGDQGNTTTTLQNSFALTSTWTQFWEVFSIGDMSARTFGAGEHASIIWWLSKNTAQTIEMTGFQAIPWDPAVAKPASAPPFTPRPLAVELAACQRYRQVKTLRGVNGARHVPLAPMVAAPSVTLSAGTAAHITANGFELTHTTDADITVTAEA